MSHLPLVREKLLVKVKPPVMEKPQVKVTLPGMVRPPGSVKLPEMDLPQDLGLLPVKVKRPVTEKLQVIPKHSFYRHPILPPRKLPYRPDARGQHRKHTLRDFSTRHQDHNCCRSRFGPIQE